MHASSATRRKVAPALCCKPAVRGGIDVDAQRTSARYMAAVSSRAIAGERIGEGGEHGRYGRILARYGAHLGFGIAALAALTGWLARDRRILDADYGFGYFLGLVAVACMSALLVYPLRKRFAFLKFLGPTKNWFKAHMLLGTLGPLAALYHCNFTTGSVNGSVALYAAVLVAVSGFVGRYIYSKVHLGLYGRRTDLKELLSRIEIAAPAATRAAQFVPELTRRLVQFDRAVLVPPAGLGACFVLPLRLAVLTRLEYSRLMAFARREIRAEALRSVRLERYGPSLERITREYVRNHLRQVRRVAEFVAYQRLFALWHVVHRPFFAILALAAVIHVVAVNVY
jgi:hypothetical protein